jgi:uncharacterized protein YjbI with pentapeptide repeats
MDNDATATSSRQGRQRRRLIAGGISAVVIAGAVIVGGTWQHSQNATSGALGGVGCPAIDATTHVSSIPFTPGVDWSTCDLHGANFTAPTNFSNANLSNATLAGWNLAGANFTGANLTGADLRGANLTSATLTGATLTNVVLTGVNLTGVRSGQIVGAVMNVQSGQLVGSDPVLPAGWYGGFGGYLMGPNADLTNADLNHDIIGGALKDLTGANLTGANLSGASFTGVTMTGVKYSNTICPNGTNSSVRNPQTCVGQGGGL